MAGRGWVWSFGILETIFPDRQHLGNGGSCPLAGRAGKGIRTAPRDALVADSIDEKDRGLAFGFHRAADTAGALVGILIAAGLIWLAQANSQYLSEHTFHIVVLVSLVPAIPGGPHAGFRSQRKSAAVGKA